jgi:hypothetical protein
MKNHKLIIPFIAFMLLSHKGNSQFAFTKGNNVFEVSGAIVGYYNYRFYDKGVTNKHDNKFALDFAEIKFKGVYEKNITYKLEANFAGLTPVDAGKSEFYIGSDFLREASIEYSGLRKYATIEVGYDKIPFSRSSLTEYDESPFLQRGEIARGDVFLRRDMGLTLSHEFLNRRINVYAGVYSGMGEMSLGGDNDPSGRPSFAGRIDYSWHARYRYSEYDLEGMPIPVIAIGANGSYSEKKITTGSNYSMETIDGKKKGYGADADIKYRHITAHFEALQFRLEPNDKSRLLGYPTSYFMAGGIIASINYYYKEFHSVIAVRYDELNPNDLTANDTRATISFAYNYLIDKTNSCLKIHYWHRLKKGDDSVNEWTEDQLRIGYQLLF